MARQVLSKDPVDEQINHRFKLNKIDIYSYLQMEKPVQQLKRLPFFAKQLIQQQAQNSAVHAKLLNNISLRQAVMIYPRLILLEDNEINVFQNKSLEYSFSPFTQSCFFIKTNTSEQGGHLFAFGIDKQISLLNSYIKIWEIKQGERLSSSARKKILIGKQNNPIRQPSHKCFSVLKDMTAMALVLNENVVSIYESKHLLSYDPNRDKSSTRQIKAPVLKSILLSRRSTTELDLYYSTDQAFFNLINLSETKKLLTNKVDVLDLSKKQTVLGSGSGDVKCLVEFDHYKNQRQWPCEGQKLFINCFKDNYTAVVTYQKRQKMQKYTIQILDMQNIFSSYHQEFVDKIEWIGACSEAVWMLVLCPERKLFQLTQRDNAFKIQTFFKKKHYNQAYRFASNQHNSQQLLGQISRLHGDFLYNKKDFNGAIKQYILTIGQCQPSYVIRKFLDISQIQYLVTYLQNLHSLKRAEKEHTALLLNCYVKQRRIQQLSQFLSNSNFDSNLFDVQTAIKVCRELGYLDLAQRLSQQKKQHMLLLRILIQDKRQIKRALQYIKLKVSLQEKENLILQFGQDLMSTLPKETLELIKNLAKVQSIALQLKNARDRKNDEVSSLDQPSLKLLQSLGISRDQIPNITSITFRTPDQFLRLFMKTRNLMEEYLEQLLNMQKLAKQQVIVHKLFELYLERHQELSKDYGQPFELKKLSDKIKNLLEKSNKKFDKSHVLFLFKMYDFQEGIVNLYSDMNKHQQLMHYYILHKKHQEIIEHCINHAKSHTNLWVQALMYFSNPSNKMTTQIPRILKYIQDCPGISPLLVLKVLSKHKNINFKQVKQYFLSRVKFQTQKLSDSRYVLECNFKAINNSKEEYKKLKTSAKVFQINRCTKCQQDLALPSFYFMCGHAFHDSCLSGERNCSKCNFELNRKVIERKQTFEREKSDQKKLLQQLQDKSGNPFDTVCQLMGKGAEKTVKNEINKLIGMKRSISSPGRGQADHNFITKHSSLIAKLETQINQLKAKVAHLQNFLSKLLIQNEIISQGIKLRKSNLLKNCRPVRLQRQTIKSRSRSKLNNIFDIPNKYSLIVQQFNHQIKASKTRYIPVRIQQAPNDCCQQKHYFSESDILSQFIKPFANQINFQLTFFNKLSKNTAFNQTKKLFSPEMCLISELPFIIAKFSAVLNRTALFISRTFETHQHPQSLYKRITIFLTKQFQCDKASLYTVDYQRNQIRSKNKQIFIRMPIGKGIAGICAKRAQMINLQDVYKSKQFNRQYDIQTGYNTKSMLCVPIVNCQGFTQSVIQLINKKEKPFYFNQIDQTILLMISKCFNPVISQSLQQSKYNESNKSMAIAMQICYECFKQSNQTDLIATFQQKLKLKFLFNKVKVLLKSRSSQNFLSLNGKNLVSTSYTGLAQIALEQNSTFVKSNLKEDIYYNPQVDISTNLNISICPITTFTMKLGVIEFITYSGLDYSTGQISLKQSLSDAISCLGSVIMSYFWKIPKCNQKCNSLTNLNRSNVSQKRSHSKKISYCNN